MDSAGSGKVPFMVTCKHENRTPDSIRRPKVTKRRRNKAFREIHRYVELPFRNVALTSSVSL